LVLCEGVKVHDKCKQTEGNFSPFINVCVWQSKGWKNFQASMKGTWKWGL
jgi:hypothetical protein